MPRRPFPNDRMVIPQVAEVCAEELVRFFWCWSCQELFAFVGDPGRLVARLAADGQGGWRLFRAVGAAHEVQIALAAASQVRPEPATWRLNPPAGT